MTEPWSWTEEDENLLVYCENRYKPGGSWPHAKLRSAVAEIERLRERCGELERELRNDANQLPQERNGARRHLVPLEYMAARIEQGIGAKEPEQDGWPGTLRHHARRERELEARETIIREWIEHCRARHSPGIASCLEDWLAE